MALIFFEKQPIAVTLLSMQPYYYPLEDRQGSSGIIHIVLDDQNSVDHKYDISIIGNPWVECQIISSYEAPQGIAKATFTRNVIEINEDYGTIEYQGELSTEEEEVKFAEKVQLFTLTTRIAIHIDRCKLCKDIFKIASGLGCGVGLAAICSILMPTGVPGVICLGISATVCYYIRVHGTNKGAELACKDLGICKP